MPPDVATRPATLDDVPAIRAILRAHDEDSEPAGVDIVGPYVRHLVRHGIARVADRDGQVVGYGAAIDAGVARHLADLFIRPDLLGHGIGKLLLGEVLAGAERRTTFASADPRAIPLYVRAGMTPLWTLFALEGSPLRLPETRPGLAVEVADAPFLATLERDWTGTERPADHAFWASQAAAEGLVVLDGGEPVALGYARARQVSDSRVIDRLIVRPEVDPVAPMLAAFARAARFGTEASAGPRGSLVTYLAGPSPVLPVLLEAGFRIIERDQYLALQPDFVDPARFIPNSGML